MTPLPPPPLRLAPDEARLLHLAAGTLLLVQDGCVRYEGPPHWLDGQWLPTHRRLDAGTCHQVDDAGWIRVTALRDSELRIIVANEEAGLLELLLARLRWLRSLEIRKLREEVRALRILAGPGEKG